MTRKKRVADCGALPVGPTVDVHRTGTADAPRGTITGVGVCGSVWGCPVCSAHLRAARSLDLEHAVARHIEDGGGVVMVTLTLRHRSGDDLGQLVDGMRSAWRKTTAGAPWQRTRNRHGVIGMVRATEVTWGEANGWHPHLHVLLFTASTLDAEQLVALRLWLARRWVEKVEAVGLRSPDLDHGTHLLEVTDDRAAAYVAKVQEPSAIALEATRGDLKPDEDRGGCRRWLPFELGWAAGNGEARAVALWHAYEAAMHGHRMLTWSRGLRRRLGLGAEVEDVEILAEHDVGPDTVLVTVEARTWRRVVRAGLVPDVIEAAGAPGTWESARRAVESIIAEGVRRRGRHPTRSG